MAKKWTNRNMPGALHFVTGNTLNRKPLFKNGEYCLALLGEIQRLRTIGRFKLVALVIMLDHFHLIINPPDGDIQAAMRDLKSFAAKAIMAVSNEGLCDQIWQEGFKVVPLERLWPGDQEKVIPEVRKWEAERAGRLEAQIEKNRAK